MANHKLYRMQSLNMELFSWETVETQLGEYRRIDELEREIH